MSSNVSESKLLTLNESQFPQAVMDDAPSPLFLRVSQGVKNIKNNAHADAGIGDVERGINVAAEVEV